MAIDTVAVSPVDAGLHRWQCRLLDASRIAAIVMLVAIPVSTALVSVALGVWLLAMLGSGCFPRIVRQAFAQPLGKAILVFFVVVTLGMLHGPADWHGRLGSLWSWRKLLYAFLLLGLFPEARWRDRVYRTVAVAGAVAVLASFAAWLGWVPSKPNNEIGVLFQNHTTQGMFFALALLCCAQWAQVASGRVRLALGVAIVLLLANIMFVSPGRSTYFVVVAIMFAIGVQRFGIRRVPAVMAVVAALCAGAYGLSPLVQERVDVALHEAATADHSEILTSVGFRAVVYRNTLELIAARPLAGYGTGSFERVYTPHVRARYEDWRGEGTADPHNQYFLIAMETGVIGLLAFAAVIWTALACTRRGGVHVWIGAAALLGWMLTSLFNSHFRTFPEGHMIALVLGTMLAAPAKAALPRSGGDAAAG